MRIRYLLAVFIFASVAGFAGAQSITAPQSQQRATHARSSSDLLDINTATPQQLKALPGFGDAYVRRVIDGRPYTAKNQLVTRGVLPQSAYDAVSSLIVAHRPAKRP